MLGIDASGQAADATDGPGGDLPQAASVAKHERTPDLPVFAAEREDRAADQVWSSDITYVPMPQGWMYLTVVMDWFSRYVLSWQLSNTLDGRFCLEALEEALGSGAPEVFNTDQGVQFTAEAFTGCWRRQACG